MKISHGEYIFFIDSDDQITKGSIGNILHNLYKSLNAEIFVMNFYALKAGRKILNIVNKKERVNRSKQLRILSDKLQRAFYTKYINI